MTPDWEPCKRCGKNTSLPTRQSADVSDLESYDVVIQPVWLCVPCRVAAVDENARALSRRTKPTLERPAGGW